MSPGRTKRNFVLEKRNHVNSIEINSSQPSNSDSGGGRVSGRGDGVIEGKILRVAETERENTRERSESVNRAPGSGERPYHR